MKLEFKDDDSIELSTYTTDSAYNIKNADATTTIYPVDGTNHLLIINRAPEKGKIDRVNVQVYDTHEQKILAHADNLDISKNLMEPNSFALDMDSNKLFYLETDFEPEYTINELEKPKNVRAYDFNNSKNISIDGITNKDATSLRMMRNGKLVISNESNNTWSLIDTRNVKILKQGEGEIDGIDLRNDRDQALVTPSQGFPYFMPSNGPSKSLQLFQKGALQDISSAGEHVWFSSVKELRYINLKDLEIQKILNEPHTVLSLDRTGGNILVALPDEQLGKILSISPDGKKTSYTLPTLYIPTGVATRLDNGWLINAITASDSGKLLREMDNDIDHISEGLSNSDDLQSTIKSYYYFIGDNNKILPPIEKTGVPNAIAYSPRKKILATKELNKINIYSWPAFTLLKSIQLTRNHNAIYLTPEADVVIATGSQGAEAISLDTGSTLDTYYGNFSHSDIVVKNDDTAYLSDGNTLARWSFKQKKTGKFFSLSGRVLVSPDSKIYAAKSDTGLVLRRIPSTQSEISISPECLKPIKWASSSTVLLCETDPAVPNRKSYVTVDANDGKITAKFTNFGINSSLPLVNTDGSQIIYVKQQKEISADNSNLTTLAYKLIAFDTRTNTETTLLTNAREVIYAAISETGNYITTIEQNTDHIIDKDQDYKIKVISTSDGRLISSFQRENTEINSIAITNDGNGVLLTGAGIITKIDVRNSETEWSRNYPYVELAVLTNNDQEVLALAIGGTGRLLSSKSGEEKRRYSADSTSTKLILSGETLLAYRGAVSTVSVEYDPHDDNPLIQIVHSEEQNLRMIRRLDATHLILLREDGQLSLFDEHSESTMARMFVMDSGGWVVATDDGRFDASNMDDIAALHWVAPKSPGKAMPVEMFLSELYEPQLLWKLLSSEKLEPIPSLQQPKTSLPITAITSISQFNPESLDVTVHAVPGEEGEEEGSHIADIKLFRNNKLVGISHSSNRTDPDLKSVNIKFSNIQLPSGDLNEEIKFSTYAFNKAGLKGPTSSQSFSRQLKTNPKGKNIYLITIGINNYSNTAFNLDYAASDATQLRERLISIFKNEKNISHVYSQSLITPESSNTLTPTKENIRLTLEGLSQQTKSIITSELQPTPPMPYAKTGDSVIIFYSGHGYFSPHGELYIFPSDIAKDASKDKKITDNILKSAISTSELAEWMENIDAQDITLILDACHSAGAVGSNFRPGPLASKGLGQLAYDKGMRILAATQSDSVALETEELKHGYLSYALINDGLDKGLADFRPSDGVIWIDEWLAYARKHVPQLASGDSTYAITKKGEKGAPRLFKYRGDIDDGDLAQRPVLYDFSRIAPTLKLSTDETGE
jgi:hypothetical protein